MFKPMFDKELIDKVKAANPGASLRVLKCEEFEETIALIVKVPSQPEFKRFRSMQEDPEQGVGASIRTLAQTHVVYPDAQEYVGLVERFPGLPESITRQLVRLAGAVIPLQVEKI